MKRKLFLLLVISVLTVPFAFGKQEQVRSQSAKEAKVLKVERHVVTDNDLCCYTNDAPLQSEYFAYDVSVQVGCNTYEGEYSTALDSFPLGIAPGKPVNVQVSKHDLNFSGPATRDLKVPITHRSTNAKCS